MALDTIRILSDGRPGHENQSTGLAEALRLRTGAAVQCVRLDRERGVWRKIRAASRLSSGENPPGLLIAAGHRTHIPLLVASRVLGARSVVIMKPSLPAWLFDLCLVPRHDLRDPDAASGRTIATRGALNRIAETPAEKTDTGLVLVGGPSKHHGWDAAPFPAMIREIVSARPRLAWTVGDSRRTPAGFLGTLADCGATLVPHRETAPGWLPRTLGAAREAWVSEDSVSMIFEALTAGARVGILPVPVKSPNGRTVKAVSDLVASGYVRTYADWKAAPEAWANVPRLRETARCADIILDRFFHALSTDEGSPNSSRT